MTAFQGFGELLADAVLQEKEMARKAHGYIQKTVIYGFQFDCYFTSVSRNDAAAVPSHTLHM